MRRFIWKITPRAAITHAKFRMGRQKGLDGPDEYGADRPGSGFGLLMKIPTEWKRSKITEVARQMLFSYAWRSAIIES